MIQLIDKIKKYHEKTNITIFDIEKYSFYKIIKNYYEDYFKQNITLDELHKLLTSNLITESDKDKYNRILSFGINDRDCIFNKIFYKYYDDSTELKDMYYRFIKEYIKPTYFPNENKIVVQKTPNIRIHFPETTAIGKLQSDPNNLYVGIHSDSDFGHSVNEINFILPITNMYDTNSIYFEPFPNSDITYDKYLNVKLNNNELGIYYFSRCKHFNKINKTSKTRISFDFRIIPYSQYYLSDNKTVTSNTKLVIGDYFIIL
jgi:hypothetical protein